MFVVNYKIDAFIHIKFIDIYYAYGTGSYYMKHD